ncbi:TIGR00730 family Rossman fold protein [Patescibacteria group bacterium]|nr:MAG: TIGR00730 family Rossman fold protein [Patescibacteria group bacterium]
MHRATQERIYEISREFEQGFKFLERFPKSVTFFGSTRVSDGHPDYDHARLLAGRITRELGYSVVTGGGPGIMEAANRGAKETGGHSVGLTIRLPKEQVMNDYLTEHVDFYYFFSRKVCLAYSAEAFLFFPGGLGTLDECLENITLLQTHKIPSVPVILVGDGYWENFREFLRKNLLERRTIDPEDLELFTIENDDEKILSIIKSAPVKEFVPYKGLRVNPIE